ncbi:MAG: ABC transporter substrate-binding protein, partial [Eubacteriales bacterium]|nr:ABC transporter substrate-binding protein [Eubacteriales bacterium]
RQERRKEGMPSGMLKNMKDALKFISELYQEGLIDPETLLNDKAGWEGKINSDKVGVCFHWAESAATFAESMKTGTGTEPEWVALPAISAPGYEGFYTEKQCIGFQWVVKNTDDEAAIDAIMKVLDAYGNKELWEDFYYGVDGMHSEIVDGKRQKKPDDPSTQENLVLKPWDGLIDLDFKVQILENTKTEDRAWALDQSINAMNDTQQYGKVVAGDGMPSSVYDGYADILNKTLYVEYASKIITGEYDIDKFDEFVERWYASGGEEVTQAARAWYASKQE